MPRKKGKRIGPSVKEWEEFDKAVERGEVPSGGWCKCCEKYACGGGGPNHT